MRTLTTRARHRKKGVLDAFRCYIPSTGAEKPRTKSRDEFREFCRKPAHERREIDTCLPVPYSNSLLDVLSDSEREAARWWQRASGEVNNTRAGSAERRASLEAIAPTEVLSDHIVRRLTSNTLTAPLWIKVAIIEVRRLESLLSPKDGDPAEVALIRAIWDRPHRLRLQSKLIPCTRTIRLYRRASTRRSAVSFGHTKC